MYRTNTVTQPKLQLVLHAMSVRNLLRRHPCETWQAVKNQQLHGHCSHNAASHHNRHAAASIPSRWYGGTHSKRRSSGQPAGGLTAQGTPEVLRRRAERPQRVRLRSRCSGGTCGARCSIKQQTCIWTARSRAGLAPPTWRPLSTSGSPANSPGGSAAPAAAETD